MQISTAGPEDGTNLILVLGWGNRTHHENVQWLVEVFTDEGYRVHTFQIPDVITDFDDEYLAPVQEYAADLDSYHLLTHSTGGLIGAYLDGAETETYLSPWWGMALPPVGVDGLLLDLFKRLPTARPILPSGESSRSDLGELATDEQLSDGPTNAAPTFLKEVSLAHENRPPIDDDAVVFCTLRDPVVGVRAIGDAVPASQIVLYDGGHELFSSESRDSHRQTLLDAVEHGVEALS